MLRLNIEHSVLPIRAEKRYDPATKIGPLKQKLYIVTGTKPEHQRLELKDDEKFIGILGDEDRSLEQYGAVNGMTIRVVDQDPFQTTAQYSNVEAVEKYEISEDDYNKRDNTFRKWKERNLPQKETKEKEQVDEEAPSEEIKVGLRCEVQTTGQPRGTIEFVGKTQFGDGYWVGVCCDEPVGKNNGSVKGVKYFECDDGYGLFVKPDKIVIGDFPEEGFESDIDEDEDEI